MAKNHELMYNCVMKIFSGMHKYVWLEFAIWFLILCVCISGVRIHNYRKEKALVTYQIFMPDVDGLVVGSPVKFMGVQVGFIEKIKIVREEVYVKFVITDKSVTLPKGSVATVEFNGMGGSKSLEVYAPTEESLAGKKLLVVQNPTRLNDALGLLSEMFDKIDSITTRTSFFAKETGMDNMESGIKLDEMQTNMNVFDKIIKKVSDIKNEGVENEQSESQDNQ